MVPLGPQTPWISIRFIEAKGLRSRVPAVRSFGAKRSMGFLDLGFGSLKVFGSKDFTALGFWSLRFEGSGF